MQQINEATDRLIEELQGTGDDQAELKAAKSADREAHLATLEAAMEASEHRTDTDATYVFEKSHDEDIPEIDCVEALPKKSLPPREFGRNMRNKKNRRFKQCLR